MQPAIVRFWRCLDSSQRAVTLKLSLASQTIVPAVKFETIQSDFFVDAGIGQIMKLQAYIEALRLERTFYTFPDGVFDALLANKGWMLNIALKFLEGCIKLDDPLCQQLTFPSPSNPRCLRE